MLDRRVRLEVGWPQVCGGPRLMVDYGLGRYKPLQRWYGADLVETL
jgi:hypothetical protein